MIDRDALPYLHRLAAGFPVVCVTGPRQSGKTTLVRAAFHEKPYISLDDPDIARAARTDPRGLLDTYRDGCVLDEAQAVPEIFSYLKTAVDAAASPGRYVVTGSRQFDLLSGVTESLAGRAALCTLLPFSASELKAAGKLDADPFAAIVRGFYPPLYDRPVSPYDWYAAYIAAYVERDVRSLVSVRDLGQFQTFVRMCAARTGRLLNLSDLSRDCGVSQPTAKTWLSILETSGIVYLLRPYHRNFGKRLVKSPKLYFLDTGLACRLLGIADGERLFLHPDRGPLFESFIVAEFLKDRFNRGLSPDLYFWRDNVGAEVDLILDDGSGPRAVEIKSGKTINADFTAALETWMRYSGAAPESCAVVYAGDRELSVKGIGVVKWDGVGDMMGNRQ